MKAGPRFLVEALLASSAVCLNLAGLVAPAQGPVQVEDIIKVWETRQNKVDSLRAEWTEEITVPKGAISGQLPPILSKGEILPPVDLSYQSPVKLSMDKEKLFYQFVFRQWEPSKNAFFDIENVRAFDGNADRHLTGKGAGLYPNGVITKEPLPFDIKNFRLYPYLLHFRATHPKLGPFRGVPLRLTGNRALVQNRICLELELLQGPAATRLWVDPNNEYSVVRAMIVDKGVVRTKIDVVYGLEEKVGVVPMSWDIIANHIDGKLNESVHVKKTTHEFNVAIPSDLFSITWPSGAFVRDLKTDKQFIQKEGMEVRPVQKSEMTLPYEALVTGAAPTNYSKVFSWPIILTGSVLAVGGGILAASWLMRRRTPRKDEHSVATVSHSKPPGAI